MSYKECNAKSKRTGQKCTARAMKGSDKCYHHGGKSLAGAASPTFKTGRHSKYLPKQLLSIYEETQSDPELLSVRQDISLIDTFLNFKLQQLFDSEGGRQVASLKAWEAVKAQIKDARFAYKAESYAGLELALDTMEELANNSILYYETEREIKADIEQRRKLVETEQKITLQGERAISAESVMLLMAQVLDVIKTVVTDDRQRLEIAAGIQQLVTVEDS